MAPQGPEGSSERMLALAQIKGQIKAQSVEKVGNMVQQNPSDSVAVIRSWVHDQPAGA
jgi:flagellar M-ring protein FliF